MRPKLKSPSKSPLYSGIVGFGYGNPELFPATKRSAKMKTPKTSFSIACALLAMVCIGCSSSEKSDWRISEIKNVIDNSQVRVKHIVAIRILGDNQLEVITKEGGPLAGGGVNITMTRRNGVWIIEKTEGYDS